MEARAEWPRLLNMRVNLQAEWLTMALLSAPDRKVMEEAQQRGSDLCGRVNMPPLFMQSQAGAGGRRGDPSQRAMSEPLEWPRPGQAVEVGCKERKKNISQNVFFSLFLSAESHSCLFWAGARWRALGFFPVFPLKNSWRLFVRWFASAPSSPPPSASHSFINTHAHR